MSYGKLTIKSTCVVGFFGGLPTALCLRGSYLPDDENDWRMQDVGYVAKDTFLPAVNQIAEKGSQITFRSIAKLNKRKLVSIVLPNATALCINSSKRSWEEAVKIRKSSKIDSSLKNEVVFRSTSDSFDYIERVMESIIMAFTALEAFVNENIPDGYEYHCHKKSEIILEIMDKKAIERWLSLDEKLSVILPLAKSIESPKGKKCWQGFKDLKDTRNRIVHMKKEDRRSSGPEIPTLWHKLLKSNAPYIQAKDMIGYFVKETGEKPRWYSEYPR